MRPSVPTLLAVVLCLAFPSGPGARAAAQIAPLTFELRAGGTIPIQEMADPDVGWAGDVGSGASFGMSFAYSFNWYAGAYAGFSQHRFGCTASACGRDTKLVATGFDLGGRFLLGTGWLRPVIRAGVVTYRVEGTAPAGDGGTVETISRRTVGLEAGLGLDVPVAEGVSLSPGVRYLRMRPDFGALGDLHVRSLMADLGVVLSF